MNDHAFGDPNRNKLTDSLNLNIKILKLFGIWPLNQSGGDAERFIREVRYCLSFVLFIYGIMVCHIIYIYMNYSKLSDMITCMSTTSVTFVIILKAEIIRWNPQMIEILRILSELDHPTFKENQDIERCITLSCKQVEWGKKLVFYTGGFASFFAVTLPLLYHDDIYMAWYPYDGTTKRFWIIYIYQVLVLVISILADVSVNTMISGLLALCAGQVQAQNYHFRDLVHFIVQEMNEEILHGTQQNDQLHFNLEYQKMLEKRFPICVDRHQKVLMLVKLVHQEFGVILLVQIIVSTTIICSLMFMFTILDPTSVSFLQAMSFFTITVQQMFLFCWHGNNITFKSGKFMESIIQSEWLSFGRGMRQKLILLLAFNQNPISFKVGKIIPVNMLTFIRIMNTCWSIFSLLKSVQVKDGTTH